MDNIIKALEKFLTRDLLYILGGSSILLSIGFYFELQLPSSVENYLLCFYIGVSYVIGYIVQETISLLPILTTAHFKPNTFIKKIYKIFNNHDFNENIQLNNIVSFTKIYPSLSDKQAEQIERTITLKHVGATMGSNWLVCSIFLIISATHSPCNFKIFLASSIFILSLFLILISWVKGAQQIMMLYEISKDEI